MMKRYFEGCATLEELKAEYKKQALRNHPDRGGDTATMQQINAEYEKMFALLKNTHKNVKGETYTKETQEAPNEFIDLINKLIKMEGVHIEVIGSFIWLSGDTKPHKDEIKALGFRWSNDKKMWYLAPEGYKKRSRKHCSIEEIRESYGVQFEADGKSSKGFGKLLPV